MYWLTLRRNSWDLVKSSLSQIASMLFSRSFDKRNAVCAFLTLVAFRSIIVLVIFEDEVESATLVDGRYLRGYVPRGNLNCQIRSGNDAQERRLLRCRRES